MTRASASPRPAGHDDLGLRRALSDRLLPLLVCAMVFLAALALAGAMGAASLAAHWNHGAAAVVTVTIPAPPSGGAAQSADAASRVLAASPAIASVRRLTDQDIGGLLKPWLGVDPALLSLPLPILFEVRMKASATDPGLPARLQEAAPGAVMERNGDFLARLALLVRSLQACASLSLLVVTLVASAVVAVATQAGLAARRDSIEIVHGLGAPDGWIARQFATRVTMRVLAGAMLGVLLVLPLLLALARLAAPFGAGRAMTVPGSPTMPFMPASIAGATLAGLGAALPPLLWGLLASLPLMAGGIGWVTAQITVRSWLRLLP